ncbi:MAG: hypothetical protein LBI30_00605 [Holosporales bacterium]|nr:hypothetical protein [Holosporales bacterium]
MDVNLKLRILSEKSPIFNGEASLVLLPTAEGQIGILPKHAPYFASIVKGGIVIKNRDGVKTIPVSDGYCSVFNDVVTVFDSAKDYEIYCAEKEISAVSSD